ncbi:MAG: nitrite reductase small subunit NirD [Paenibacillus macerans]|nr:nitrite reductase small subunit NirD [Paenibacillus macerans]MBS5909369.1 nitrite reductase small subunit NirD [Paenibacillus macerans]MCY7560386.1 nitrite reductase small subunit NirD [Paenibacillus macerans]MDU5951227.1 nitrite reductase small subunit NirD [Paenibacillus macerans]MDU7471965.1 nitrite reductase small subunit NirD [Paenibacillus macerans]MEC0137125.1 nitrite reductase small subunit NirD [Paenibacillus macerans]
MNKDMSKEAFFPVGHVEQFLPQIGRVVEAGGRELAVFRLSDGRIFAALNQNPHPKGGPLAEGIVSGHYLYDPLYDWKIDLTTGLVQAPDSGQVPMFPVKVEDGQVWIAASALQEV